MEKDDAFNYIIRTEGLSRDFHTGSETVHALRDISVRMESGKLNMLRGRSGSGKTTLINLLSALDTPDSGKIFFNGEDITAAGEKYRNTMRRKKNGVCIPVRRSDLHDVRL